MGTSNQPAAFVPSNWLDPLTRTPAVFVKTSDVQKNITFHEHCAINSSKLNTVPDTALNDIEKFLDIWTFEVEKCWKSENWL